MLFETSFGALKMVVNPLFNFLQQRNKAKASISLIYEHAKLAKDRLEEPGLIGRFEEMKRNIQNDKDYTPFFLYDKESNLTFKQIQKILHHLKEDDRKFLLTYFYKQSEVNTIFSEMNKDVFRNLSRERKIRAVDILIKETKKLHKSTNDLIEVLNRRNKKK